MAWESHEDYYSAQRDDLPKLTCNWAPGDWDSIEELRWIEASTRDVYQTIGGRLNWRSAVRSRPIDVSRVTGHAHGGFAPHPVTAWALGDIIVYDNTFISGEERAKFVFAHEFAHVWDFRHQMELSKGLAEAVGTWVCTWHAKYGEVCMFDPDSSVERPAYDRDRVEGPYAFDSFLEDWAESFASFVYPQYSAPSGEWMPLVKDGIRENYVQQAIDALP